MTIRNMDVDPNGDLPQLYLIIDITAAFVVIVLTAIAMYFCWSAT
jgi:hypothetical protein